MPGVLRRLFAHGFARRRPTHHGRSPKEANALSQQDPISPWLNQTAGEDHTQGGTTHLATCHSHKKVGQAPPLRQSGQPQRRKNARKAYRRCLFSDERCGHLPRFLQTSMKVSCGPCWPKWCKLKMSRSRPHIVWSRNTRLLLCPKPPACSHMKLLSTRRSASVPIGLATRCLPPSDVLLRARADSNVPQQKHFLHAPLTMTQIPNDHMFTCDLPLNSNKTWPSSCHVQIVLVLSEPLESLTGCLPFRSSGIPATNFLSCLHAAACRHPPERC